MFSAPSGGEETLRNLIIGVQRNANAQSDYGYPGVIANMQVVENKEII